VVTNNVKLLGVTGMQTAKAAAKKHIWSKVILQEENIRIKLDK
jgi:hypothetical protein